VGYRVAPLQPFDELFHLISTQNFFRNFSEAFKDSEPQSPLLWTSAEVAMHLPTHRATWAKIQSKILEKKKRSS
jgi:hypothetical protein